MITNESFTKEWIESFRQQEEYRKIDPALLEKMIHALALVEKAQSASARAAYLASKLQANDYSKLKVYEPDADLANYEIKNQAFGFLNRFKKINREVFFYWYQCLSQKGQLEG